MPNFAGDKPQQIAQGDNRPPKNDSKDEEGHAAEKGTSQEENGAIVDAQEG
jgi:hypothetical protein